MQHHTYNVAFPMPILNNEGNNTIKDWRSTATKCQSLTEHSDSHKAYLRLSKEKIKIKKIYGCMRTGFMV